MLVKYVSLGIIAVCVIVIALSVLAGGKKTAGEALARLLSNFLAGFVAVMFTPLIVRAIGAQNLSFIVQYLPEDLLNNEVLTEISENMAVAVVSIAIYSLFYLILFNLLKLIAKIAVSKDKVTEGTAVYMGNKAVSMVLYGINAALFLFLFITPSYTLLVSAAEDAAIVASAETENIELQTALTSVKETTQMDNPKENAEEYKNMRTPFTSFVYDHLTAFDYNGVTTNIHDEIVSMANVFANVAPIIPKEEFKANAENVELVRTAKNEVFKDEFLKTVIIEMTHDACRAWYNGATYMSMADPFAETDYSNAAKRLYGQLMNADEKQLDGVFDLAISMIKVKAATDQMNELAMAETSAVLGSINDKDTIKTFMGSINEDNAEMVVGLLESAIITDGSDWREEKSTMDDLFDFADSMEGTVSEKTVMQVMNALVLAMATVDPDDMDAEVDATAKALDIVGKIMDAPEGQMEQMVDENYAELIDITVNSEILTKTIASLANTPSFRMFKLSDAEKANANKIMDEYRNGTRSSSSNNLDEVLANFEILLGL